MTCTPRLTDAWERHKNDFITRNSENSFLLSAIKKIERQLADCVPLEVSTAFSLGIISEKTAFTTVSLSELCCLYIFNHKENEIAPCFLFFPCIEAARKSPYASYAKAVLDELGWGRKARI